MWIPGSMSPTGLFLRNETLPASSKPLVKRSGWHPVPQRLHALVAQALHTEGPTSATASQMA